MILTGRQVKAEEALRIGLADRVVPAASLQAEARSLAAALARGPHVAQSYAKQAIDAGLDLPLHEAITNEQELFVQVFDTEDAAIGVRSFLESGPGRATFTGR